MGSSAIHRNARADDQPLKLNKQHAKAAMLLSLYVFHLRCVGLRPFLDLSISPVRCVCPSAPSARLSVIGLVCMHANCRPAWSVCPFVSAVFLGDSVCLSLSLSVSISSQQSRSLSLHRSVQPFIVSYSEYISMNS